LVTRHQFGKNTAHFERAHRYRQHDHVICTECGHVMEFCDPRIQQIQDLASELLDFSISSHALNFYGRCNQLARTGTCANKISKN
jgi:Fur family ferric uptake transcriptional regulator